MLVNSPLSPLFNLNKNNKHMEKSTPEALDIAEV